MTSIYCTPFEIEVGVTQLLHHQIFCTPPSAPLVDQRAGEVGIGNTKHIPANIVHGVEPLQEGHSVHEIHADARWRAYVVDNEVYVVARAVDHRIQLERAQ